ncbi:MAG: hypothetical protein BEN19_06510 [Epulopiscium sp. Nuni2H_MBin003]|nr:MAG: hypothetical protein BEN19_06510 [Epulopiscium sp. Nuni2H_MBin003]
MASRNISDLTKKSLYAKSGNQCAFDGCNTSLIDEKEINIGQMCHIHGINPGSARYNSDLDSDYLNSEENLILLCGNHHKTIDSDPISYTPEIIIQMKRTHEDKINRHIKGSGNRFFEELEIIFKKYDFYNNFYCNDFTVPFRSDCIYKIGYLRYDIEDLINSFYSYGISSKVQNDLRQFTNLLEDVMFNITGFMHSTEQGFAKINDIEQLKEILKIFTEPIKKINNIYEIYRYANS